jgi:hypothetical protein
MVYLLKLDEPFLYPVRYCFSPKTSIFNSESKKLWWKDLYFFIDILARENVRPWIWADYIWHHREEFLRKIPEDVILSNWYYGSEFNEDINYAKTFIDLEEGGYKQIPAGSNWSFSDNFPNLVDYCIKNISEENLLGFLQTSWLPTTWSYIDGHIDAIDKVKEAKKRTGL